MPAPLIGITIYQTKREDGLPINSLGSAYVKAVLRAGGMPLLLPPQIPSHDLSSLLEGLDGILFTGGADIDPVRFNGKPHPKVYDIDLERDDLEIALVQQAAEHDLPFFGICRGIQVINVALGGTLYTDIADQMPGAIKHDYYPGYARSYEAHMVTVDQESRLKSILGGTEVPVNSLHHQGVEEIAPALRCVANAPDHLVEAVELPGHRFGLGVQWHPEAMPDAVPMQALFRAFIQAAS